jgi:hypothetical protein
MRIVFGVIGLLALIVSVVSCASAKTSIHETAGLVMALIGFLSLGVAAILTELQEMRRAVIEQFGYLGQFLRDQQKR